MKFLTKVLKIVIFSSPLYGLSAEIDHAHSSTSKSNQDSDIENHSRIVVVGKEKVLSSFNLVRQPQNAFGNAGVGMHQALVTAQSNTHDYVTPGALGSQVTRHLQAIAWEQLGGDIDGEAAGDNSGRSVSLSADGSTVAIGAYGNDGNGSNSGHVRVYQLDGTSGSAPAWVKLGEDIDGEAAGDQSGKSVSLSADGSTIAIGGDFNGGSGSKSGHVRVYQLDGTSGSAPAWVKIGEDIDGEVADDQSGNSVSLSADGSTIAIGAESNGGNNSFNSGHVRVYKLTRGSKTAKNPKARKL